MRPFNLSEALGGSPIRTRGGYKVLYKGLSDSDDYVFLADIYCDEFDVVLESCFTKDGAFLDGEESIYDLFMIDE